MIWSNKTVFAFPAAVAGLGALWIIALATERADHYLDVSIEFVGNTNSSSGLHSVLRLGNYGGATVKIDPYCTLYWTNHLKLETNMFFKLGQGYAILPPGQSNLVELPHPSDAHTWNTSFSYTVRPNWVKRILNRIRFMLPGDWVPDNSFIGRIGPVISNPKFSADGVIHKTTNAADISKKSYPTERSQPFRLLTGPSLQPPAGSSH